MQTTLPPFHDAMRRVWVKWNWIKSLQKLYRFKHTSQAYKLCENSVDPGHGNDPSGRPSHLQYFCEEIERARELSREIDDPELYETAMKDIRFLAQYPARFLEEREFGNVDVSAFWDNHASADGICQQAVEAAREINCRDLSNKNLEQLSKVKEEIADAQFELGMADKHVDSLIARKQQERSASLRTA